MTTRLHLTPAADLKLRDPASSEPHLPPEGDFRPYGEYWRRRVAGGDAVITDPQPADPQPILGAE